MKLFADGMLCAALAVIALGGCGGGGGGTTAVTTGVFINGGVGMSTTGSLGLVNVRNDSYAGTPISNATVTINSMPLTYDGALKAYTGTVMPDNAGNFSLSVTANGATYTATESAFTSLPVLTLPTQFAAASANTVSWAAPGGATGNMFYVFQILDAANTAVFNPLSLTTTTISVPANTTSAGTSYSARLRASRLGAQIANAVTGSNFSISSSVQQSFNAQ